MSYLWAIYGLLPAPALISVERGTYSGVMNNKVQVIELLVLVCLNEANF